MGLFDFLRHPDQADMSEIDRAIAHNEARGDPVPEEWYGMSARGLWSFEDDEE